MIDISGLEKPEVLLTLVHGSRLTATLREETKTREWLVKRLARDIELANFSCLNTIGINDATHKIEDYGNCGRFNSLSLRHRSDTSFDFDIRGDQFNPAGYDEQFGSGCAEFAITCLREAKALKIPIYQAEAADINGLTRGELTFALFAHKENGTKEEQLARIVSALESSGTYEGTVSASVWEHMLLTEMLASQGGVRSVKYRNAPLVDLTRYDHNHNPGCAGRRLTLLREAKAQIAQSLVNAPVT